MLFLSCGLAVGWLLRPRWRTAVLAALVLAVMMVWGAERWVFGASSAPLGDYLFATSTATLGVGLAIWDWGHSSTSGRAGGLKDSEPLKAACQLSRLKAACGYQSPI
jgi:hypothetical protein